MTSDRGGVFLGRRKLATKTKSKSDHFGFVR